MRFSIQPSARFPGACWPAAFALLFFLPVAAQSRERCSPTPLLYAGGKAGGKASERPAVLHFSDTLARSGFVVAGPAFDGPRHLRAMTDPWALASSGPRGEPVAAPAMVAGRQAAEGGTLEVERGARFIHVALPERRNGKEVLYSVSRFALVPGAGVYRVLLLPPDDQSCATAVQPDAAPAGAPAAPALSWKGVALRQVPALAESAFSMPQTAVPLTVGRRQPDLYQAATDALASPGFSQSAAQAAASRPQELVVGSAAGRHGTADFEVQMRLPGNGALDIAVLSNRNPMEINEERARALELSDRVLQAFPMLAPPAARGTPPGTMQDKKP
ncbi:MAG: hypothetical protein EOO28_26055 [Comamonadaceae bacterium]|nr:MAG: hypothetical protein EOO28_26055 [Comamonadaceae bacterium]